MLFSGLPQRQHPPCLHTKLHLQLSLQLCPAVVVAEAPIHRRRWALQADTTSRGTASHRKQSKLSFAHRCRSPHGPPGSGTHPRRKTSLQWQNVVVNWKLSKRARCPKSVEGQSRVQTHSSTEATWVGSCRGSWAPTPAFPSPCRDLATPLVRGHMQKVRSVPARLPRVARTHPAQYCTFSPPTRGESTFLPAFHPIIWRRRMRCRRAPYPIITPTMTMRSRIHRRTRPTLSSRI